MNEQDFRNELRRTMATLPARPEMSDTAVLDAARRDLKRRRTVWAGVSSAAAVIAVAVGVAVLAPSATEGSGGVEIADQQENTQAQQPTGDRGTQLAAALIAVAPAGYETPDGLVGADGKPLKNNYRNYDVASGDGTDGWAYTATVPLKKGNGIGELSVTVFGPDKDRITRETCKVNPAGFNPKHCAEVTVGDKKVGVFNNELDGDPHQMAVIMYDDTTVVAISQSAGYPWAELPSLAGLPLSSDQLAALAADPRFKIQ